jgi:polysaccharide export outer membrane protein
MRAAACILVVALLAESLPVSALAQAPVEYTVGPYDVLSVYFWNHPDLSKDAVVYSDGHITYPLIGDVVVGGLTVPQVEALITERFKTYFVEPRINVSLARATGKTVTLLGRFYKHGDYNYVEGKHLSDYIGMAGGYTQGADLGKARIIRLGPEGPQIIGIDLNLIYRDARKDLDLVMQGGDTVILPGSWFATLREYSPLLGIGITTATLIVLIADGRFGRRRS